MSNTHNAIIYNGEEYGGGSGGHGIIDAEGNEMPYEKDLQFRTGFNVTDDSENGKTIVELDANAADVSFDNTGTDLESTNAEDAIKEVQGEVEELSSKTSTYITINLADLSQRWNSIPMPSGYSADNSAVLSVTVRTNNGFVGSYGAEVWDDPNVSKDTATFWCYVNQNELGVWLSPTASFPTGTQFIVRFIKYGAQ